MPTARRRRRPARADRPQPPPVRSRPAGAGRARRGPPRGDRLARRPAHRQGGTLRDRPRRRRRRGPHQQERPPRPRPGRRGGRRRSPFPGAPGSPAAPRPAAAPGSPAGTGRPVASGRPVPAARDPALAIRAPRPDSPARQPDPLRWPTARRGRSACGALTVGAAAGPRARSAGPHLPRQFPTANARWPIPVPASGAGPSWSPPGRPHRPARPGQPIAAGQPNPGQAPASSPTSGRRHRSAGPGPWRSSPLSGPLAPGMVLCPGSSHRSRYAPSDRSEPWCIGRPRGAAGPWRLPGPGDRAWWPVVGRDAGPSVAAPDPAFLRGLASWRCCPAGRGVRGDAPAVRAGMSTAPARRPGAAAWPAGGPAGNGPPGPAVAGTRPGGPSVLRSRAVGLLPGRSGVHPRRCRRGPGTVGRARGGHAAPDQSGPARGGHAAPEPSGVHAASDEISGFDTGARPIRPAGGSSRPVSAMPGSRGLSAPAIPARPRTPAPRAYPRGRRPARPPRCAVQPPARSRPRVSTASRRAPAGGRARPALAPPAEAAPIGPARAGPAGVRRRPAGRGGPGQHGVRDPETAAAPGPSGRGGPDRPGSGDRPGVAPPTRSGPMELACWARARLPLVVAGRLRPVAGPCFGSRAALVPGREGVLTPAVPGRAGAMAPATQESSAPPGRSPALARRRPGPPPAAPDGSPGPASRRAVPCPVRVRSAGSRPADTGSAWSWSARSRTGRRGSARSGSARSGSAGIGSRADGRQVAVRAPGDVPDRVAARPRVNRAPVSRPRAEAAPVSRPATGQQDQAARPGQDSRVRIARCPVVHRAAGWSRGSPGWFCWCPRGSPCSRT